MFHGFQTPIKKVFYPTLFSLNKWKCWSYSALPQQKPKIKSSCVHIYIYICVCVCVCGGGGYVTLWNNFAYFNTDSFKFKRVIHPIFSSTLEFRPHSLLRKPYLEQEVYFCIKTQVTSTQTQQNIFILVNFFWKRMTVMHALCSASVRRCFIPFSEEKYSITQTAIYTLYLINSVHTANSINKRQQ